MLSCMRLNADARASPLSCVTPERAAQSTTRKRKGDDGGDDASPASEGMTVTSPKRQSRVKLG